MPLSSYLNPSFSGPYAQAVIGGVEQSWATAAALISYIGTISLDTATDSDLDSLGKIIGYPRPVIPAPYTSVNGYLDSPTFIILLKRIASIKFNGVTIQSLDDLIYYTLTDLGGATTYILKWSSNGASSPDADIIVNLTSAVDPKAVYILQTVLDTILKQGVVVHIVSNPFCFAKWNGSAWDTNPEGKGLSRLNSLVYQFNNGNLILLNNGNILAGEIDDNADKTHGGQMYGVI